MKTIRLDRKLFAPPHYDDALQITLVDDNIAVAYYCNMAKLPQYVIIDIDTGRHEVVKVPHKDTLQIYTEAGLVYLTLENRTKSDVLLGLHKLSVLTGTVHKIAEAYRQRLEDYWDLGVYSSSMSFGSPNGEDVWISMAPDSGQSDEHENIFFTSTPPKLHAMDSIKDHVFAFTVVRNQAGAFYALYLGRPDANDKEYYWREFGPDGLPSEKVVVVPCESILKPDQFMVVENAHKEAGLNWLFKSVNGRIFYEYYPFGKLPELRAYTPGTGTLDIRQLDNGLADVVLVEEQPYFFQRGKRHRLVEFYGDAEIRYPKTWGDPVRVIGDILFTEARLFTQDRLSRKYRAYDLKKKKLVWEGVYLLFSQNRPILFV